MGRGRRGGVVDLGSMGVALGREHSYGVGRLGDDGTGGISGVGGWLIPLGASWLWSSPFGLSQRHPSFSSSFHFPFLFTWTARRGSGYMVLHCMHGRVSALGSWSFFSSCFPFGIAADMVDRGLHSGNTTNRNRNRTTERRGTTRRPGWAPGITAPYLDLWGGKGIWAGGHSAS